MGEIFMHTAGGEILAVNKPDLVYHGALPGTIFISRLNQKIPCHCPGIQLTASITM
jgi:hypothetical protein